MLPSALMRAEGRFRAALRPMGKPTYDPRARLVSRPLERVDGRNRAARRARSTSPHRKTALMARSLGLLPLARPFRTPGSAISSAMPEPPPPHLAKVRIMLKRLVASSSSDGGSYD